MLEGLHVLVQTDNMTAKAFINRQGGSHSKQLMEEASLLFQWADSSPFLSQGQTPCRLNQCDSGLVEQTKGERCGTASPSGSVPDVNGERAFRSWTYLPIKTTRLPLFLSCRPMDTSAGTDARRHPWLQGLLYAFPPIQLIPFLLKRIRSLSTEVVLVTPHWPRCLWFPDVL